MPTYGLTRASLLRQEDSPEVQADGIRTHAKLLGLGEVKMLHEKLGTSGHSTLFAERQQGKWIMENLVEGDVLIVAKLDRLGRRASDILNTVETLHNRGVRIYIINFHGGQSLDITSSYGRLILTMFAGFAQFERDVLVERISEANQWRKKVGRAYTYPPFGFRIQAGSRPLDGSKPIKRCVPISPIDIHEIVTRIDAGERPHSVAMDFRKQGRVCRTWSRQKGHFVDRQWVPLIHRGGKACEPDPRRIYKAYAFAKRLEEIEARLAATQADPEPEEPASS